MIQYYDQLGLHTVSNFNRYGNPIFETIKMARKLLGDSTHIRLHTHETAGVSVACYLAALEAGAEDAITYPDNSIDVCVEESQLAGLTKLFQEKKFFEIAKYNVWDLKATKQLYQYWEKYLKF